MTRTTKKKIGFLTYDLQPFTADCLARIAARLPHRLKAYPVFARVDPPDPPFDYRPSRMQGLFFAVRKPGVTPEGLTASINWSGSWACVRENDVVVLFGIQGGSALLATALAWLLRRPLVAVNQTLPPLWEARRSGWVRLLKGWILHRCAIHVVQTPTTALTLEQIYHIPPDRMVFAPFEAGAGHFRALLEQVTQPPPGLRRDRGWATDETVFLFVGTLLHFKGIDTLMEAAGLLLRSGQSRFRVVCIGPVAAQSGELDLEGYRREAKKQGLESRFEFPGPRPLNGLAEAYLAADACLLPTRRDMWPKVLVEAALARLPLVTTEACGAAHSLVLEDKTGFVIEPSDAGGLARAMEKLLDPALRARLGEEARRVCLALSDPVQEVDGYLQAVERTVEQLR